MFLRYPENSIEIAYELVKLSQLQFNSRAEVSVTMDTIERAKLVFLSNYGSAKDAPSSIIQALKELEEMKECLLTFIKESVGAYWNV